MHASRRTLDVLEWPLVVERLRRHARTPGARRRLEDPAAGFAADPDEARERLAETGEARAVLALAAPPFGGLPDVAPALARAERGGGLGAGELLDTAAAVEAITATARFLARQGEHAPRLAARGSGLGDHQPLADEIRAALDSEGQVRDAASPVLAAARAEARRLAGELQRRLDATLHDPEIAPHLSDRFVTVRHDRYVLPVRADARGRVRGIVHDASSSGTTLFVEPQAVVDANNQLREAELRAEREVARVLRELADAAGREAPALRASLAGLEELDLAFARGALAAEWDGVAPAIGDEGIFVLPQLRHPLLDPARAVPNDLRLGLPVRVLVLSGPNAGGKTVAMKAVALAALCARAGLQVAAAPGARVDWTERLLADIGDAQSLRESLSTFSAHLANLARIVEEADARTLVVLDEIGDGTDPGEGAALAQAVLEALAAAGARVIATTHYGLLKEMAQVDPRFENASFEFDPHTLAPTYRLRAGVAGASSATAVAARMGLRRDVLERAGELLARTDRRLERTLAELNASRVALETERSEAARLRAETESERAALQDRLARHEARRDELYATMRRDLEQSFRRAHEEVAGVIRELQRAPGAREAEHARRALVAIEARAREALPAAGAGGRAGAAAGAVPLDWQRARPGDRVAVVGGGVGVLAALPDRHGRVAVQLGTARVLLPRERVAAPPAAPSAEEARRERAERVSLEAAGRGAGDAPSRGGHERCDLRGLRVDEALAELIRALDRAALAGRARLDVVHGIGTGALREAVCAHLAGSPYVERFDPAPPEAGGAGVTQVALR
ncbi:MAG: Smr/MutS family protein [Deltaproteobacteria bacterium]|nr:Smr/MutS family protein [Deltaproteobacteria bacterium]